MGQFTNLTAADGFVFSAYGKPEERTQSGCGGITEILASTHAFVRWLTCMPKQVIWSLAPASVRAVQPGVELGYTDADMGTSWPRTTVDALPAPGVLPDIRPPLTTLPSSGGKVGIVGFCWGGVLTWRACTPFVTD
jgi:carboxymethylenebutenolidase